MEMITKKQALEITNNKRENLKKDFINFLERQILKRSEEGYYNYVPPFSVEILYFSSFHLSDNEKRFFPIKNFIREGFYKEYFKKLGFDVDEEGISWKEEIKNNF